MKQIAKQVLMQEVCTCCVNCKYDLKHLCSPTLTQEQLFDNFKDYVINNFRIKIRFCSCGFDYIRSKFVQHYQLCKNVDKNMVYLIEYNDALIIENYMYVNNHGLFQIYKCYDNELRISSIAYLYKYKDYLCRNEILISKNDLLTCISNYDTDDAIISFEKKKFIEEIRNLLPGFSLVDTFDKKTFIIKKDTLTKKAVKNCL
jgi:hypothetical protein